MACSYPGPVFWLNAEFGTTAPLSALLWERWMAIRRRKGCLGYQIHIEAWRGQVKMAEMGRFLQGELDGESVTRGMLHWLQVTAPQAHPQPEASGSWIVNILCAKNSIALCLKIVYAKSMCTIKYIINTFQCAATLALCRLLSWYRWVVLS